VQHAAEHKVPSARTHRGVDDRDRARARIRRERGCVVPHHARARERAVERAAGAGEVVADGRHVERGVRGAQLVRGGGAAHDCTDGRGGGEREERGEDMGGGAAGGADERDCPGVGHECQEGE
jgi:hypothetical protein